MSLLDLLGITRIYKDGVEALTRKAINFTGSVTVTDDPINGRTNVAIGGGGGGGETLAGDVSGTLDATLIEYIQGHPIGAYAPNTGDVLTFDGTGWAPVAPGGGGGGGGGGDVAPDTRVFGPYSFVNQRDPFGTPVDTWHFDANNGPAFSNVNNGKIIIPLDALLTHGRTLTQVNVRVRPGSAGGGGARMLAQLVRYDVMTNYGGGVILGAVYSDTTDVLQTLAFAPGATIDLTQYSYAVALYASGSAASSADAYFGGNIVSPA